MSENMKPVCEEKGPLTDELLRTVRELPEWTALPEADGAGGAVRPHIPLSKSIYFFDSLFHLIFLKAAICPCAHTGRMC